MKTSSLLQIVLCLIMVFSASCSSKSPASTEATQPIEITSFPSKMTLNNIAMEFSGYEAHRSDFSIIICFEPPREGDWFFGDISLKIGDQEFQDFGVGRNPNPGRADGFECEAIQYNVAAQVIPSGEAELTIGRLGRFVDVDQRDCKTAQKHLDEAKTGIVVKCHPTIAGAYTVTKKPSSMSEEEAMLIAHDALSYSEAFPLDWKFVFVIEQP